MDAGLDQLLAAEQVPKLDEHEREEEQIDERECGCHLGRSEASPFADGERGRGE